MNDIANLFGNADGFDPMSIEPQADYVPVPPGKYSVEIVSAEMKETKKKTGKYLEVVCKILDGPASAVGRKIYDRMNLDNPSAIAVEIGLRSFAALGRALGLSKIPDSNMLLRGRCIACVTVKDGGNDIRTYEPLPTGTTVPLASLGVAPTVAPPVAPVVPSPLPAPSQTSGLPAPWPPRRPASPPDIPRDN